MKTETVSQEFSAAALVMLSVVLTLALLGYMSEVAAGTAVGLWLAGLWCDLRGV